MKLMVFLFLVFPVCVFANLDGVYHSHYDRNGYSCNFDADIVQSKNVLTILKWNTDCSSKDGSYNTNLAGPLTFMLLKDNKVEVRTSDDVSIYNTTQSLLTENAFSLAYNFEAYLEGEVLKYEMFFDFQLKNNILNYEITYKQNQQVIFNESASGVKNR